MSGCTMLTKMRRFILFTLTIVLLVVSTSAFSQSASGVSPEVAERIAALRLRMDHMRAVAERLQPIRNHLSAGALNLLSLAERWPALEPRLPQMLSSMPGGFAPVQVSTPGTDATITRFGGQTQSESSVAWAGSQVLVGFNDSGTLAATMLCVPPHCPSPSGSWSIDGFSRSGDKGASFKEQRYFLPDPIPAGSRSYNLDGDPVIVARNANIFYYVSLATDIPKISCAGGSGSCSDVAIARTTDGGQTWGGASPVASKDGSIHFLDKPWVAIDRSNPATMYATYTDFDNSGLGCGGLPRSAIELMRSGNGGATWSGPTVVAEYCDQEFPQGSQVAVGPGGVVYVAYEHFDADFCTRDMRIHKSVNGGVSFGNAVIVDNIIPAGDGFKLQGDIRTGFDFPSLAVDRSGGPDNGNVYLVWHDGRRVQASDPLAACGTYNYADVFFSRSTNSGASWSTPQRINTGAEPKPNGLGVDQFQPCIGVDAKGKIAVTWYDRGKSDGNWLIQRMASVSTDGGSDWSSPVAIGTGSWTSVVAQDFFVAPDYAGDYDTTTSDITGANTGFINSFSTNKSGSPDIQASKF